MKINKKLLMAALASAVIVSAPQVKTYADTQIDDTKAVTEKLIDNQLAKAAQNADQKNSEKAQAENTADADEKQKQQESSQLQSEKEINSKKTGFGSQALNHPAQATAVSNVENEADNSGLEVSDEKTPEAQKAASENSEPNYAEDEKKIKNYSGEERYRSTQMEQGDGTATNFNSPDEKNEFVDGYRYHSSEPSATSEDKTQWGIEIEIDKEKGQRTYTDFYFTNTGNMGPVLDRGTVSANEAGEKIAGGEKDPNYKATSEIEIDGFRDQRNLNLYATEEDIKHINDKDNTNTTMAWQGKYKKDHYAKPNATEGSSALFSFTVNPWPNENDKLSLIKLNGSHDQKEFVKGQTIKTGVKVENLDDNARERLVGQVYNPITGKVVPGAKAYIDENDNVVVKMPDGALMKDASGKTVINEDSIFNTPEYKNLQNLEVKFFARPRTKGEFEAIVEGNQAGFYTETGAGAATINHKGQSVTIDKQGIDRYDHYNLIGDFKLNLDDTRYYDQDFKDHKGNKIDEHSSTKVFPGEDFSVEIQDPETGAKMDGAYGRGEASGKLKEEFLHIANKQIADDLGVDYKEFITSDDYADKRWTLVGKSDNISKFTIRAPKQAKAGDFLALPVEYTYTNGSIDTHWFHFVVQETNNNKPEYLAEVGPQGNTLVNKPIITKSEADLKKNQPESYELIGDTFKDNKGNVWKVSIDQTTGAVTATLPTNLPNGKEINGGEKLTVPVKVKYTDKDTGEERTEEIKAQFIATKQHKTLTSEKLTSEIPFETKVEYDPNLPEGYFKEFQKGQNGELTTTFIQDTLNGKRGLFQTDGTFIEGDRKIEATVTREATPRIIKIGTMPSSTTIEIPFDTEYEVDDTLAAGETKIVNEGEKGEVTITTSREKDGTVKINKETTKEVKNKKIKIGTKTQGEIVDTDKIPFKYKVEFDPDFYTNYPDATENYKIVIPGKEGENTKTWTIVNSEKVGDPEVKITDPVDAVIKVGQKDYNGTVTNTVTKEVPYTVKVVKNPELEAGKSNVKQIGVAGSRTYEYTGEIVNGDLKEGSTFTEKELNDKYVAPQEEIIEIGTKPADNSKTIDSDVEVDVDIIYDPTIDKGVVNIGDLTPGKVTTVVKNVYDPETGEIVTTEETKVSNPSRKVVIGTKDFTSSYTEVDNKVTPYKTEIQFDDTLKEGEQETVQTGVDGVVTTETEVTIVNGVPTRGEPKITKSQEVQNQIIKVGTMTDGKHSYTEKLPYKYEIEYDPNLKAGEYVIDVEGAEGTKTTEWTIKNSKVVEGSANVTEHTPATNAKIRVGKKDFTGNVSHEVTEEIPYDVKIVEDPTMIAGTSEVVTEGKAGSKTTKYTQGIKNGETEGKLQSDVTAETKPTQQVIKVGTKPAENKKDYSKDVNVKVEYEYNPNLDKGVVQVGELTKGKVETKIVNKYDPATGKITTTEEEKVTEAVQKIIVGTQDFTGKYPYESTTEIPFKVVVKEDPNLAKGQSRVEQEGKAGSKTTYYEIAIKNGEKVGDPIIIKEVENDQPLDHIIYVGTAVAESSTVETVEKDIPYETKITYDENLDAGSQVVDKEGVVGKEKVTITTNITDGNGETSKTTETITAKDDREVRIGVKPVTKVVEKPFNTEYVYDENLEAGQTEEVTPGRNGKVTITTTYDKDQKKVVTSKTEEAGQNRVVKIGGKTNGTEKVKEEIPFEVEVRKDPSLKKGEWKYATDDEGNELKGVVGEQEKTLTIENSKVTNTSDPRVTKEAQNAVILVGEEDFTGEFEYIDKEVIPYDTKVTINPDLAPNEIKEITPGENGSKERTVTQKYTNGEKSDQVLGEYKTTKEPVTRVIEVGSNTKGQYKDTETIPFEIEVRKDSSVQKGEWKYAEIDGVQQTGESGLKERTITIVNSEITSESEFKTIREPKKAVILVGDEDFTGVVTHTEHFEIPFEVEVRYNDELPAGTSKEIQKGEKGSYDVEYKQAIKNGQADGELTKTETNRTEAKKHIIEVGTKVETPENNYSKDVEVEIEYVYDDTKDKGVVETGELTPGKVETKVVNKYNPETGEIEQTTEEVVTKAKQKVIVGTKDFTGTYEYEDTCPIPFEVEIIEDDTLAKGEKVVDQEGKPGSKTTKYEQDIKNGKPDGERRVVEETTTEEPTKHIVRVGTKPAEGSTEKVVEREIPFETKVIYDDTLEAGSQTIENEGKPGKEKVTITTKITDGNGKTSETTETVTEKEDRVVRVGTKPVTKETELPNDTEYRHNPDLKAGETKVIEEGSDGSVKYTTTFNKETGKLEVTEERVEPTNKVVEYGSKTEDEFTYESEQAFDTKIIEDPNLEAGKTVVDQEGVTGRTKTTVKIENSKKVSENTETLVEKQDKIVRVGTKNVCEIPPVKSTEGETTKTIEREIPFETKVIYDETLESGTQKIENEGKAGKEEVTITQKVKDSKPVGDPTETTKTITEKEDRVVRIGIKPVAKKVELGHDTEYRHNPNLKEGEQKVIEEGSNGSVKYTTTFNKETGKLEVAEERTEPKNKVVEYGSKTEGEFIYESEKAYDIIIRENPDLEAGKTKVVQEGIVGKTETTVKIENSKEVSRDTKTITEKQDKIIEIGTKNVCEIPPVDPENPDKPVDPKDPEKPGGEDPKDPEQPGEDPKDPETPGGEDPKDPEQPGGKDPKDPEQPGGKDPKDPEQPGGKDPKDPEQPGGKDPKDPEQPGGKDPKDPETPGKTPENNGKTPENNGKTPENNGKTPGATGQVDGKSTTTNNKTPKKLPKSGSESEIMMLSMSALMTAAGFVGLKKKRKDR